MKKKAFILTAFTIIFFISFFLAIPVADAGCCTCEDGSSDDTATGASCLDAGAQMGLSCSYTENACTNPGNCKISDIKHCELEGAISTLYNFGMGAGAILTVVMIMVGGVLWMMAGGSQERVSSAKSYITASLIGLVLLLTSYLILQTINPRLVNLQMPTLPNIAAIPEFQTEGYTPAEIAQIEQEMENNQLGCCLQKNTMDDFCNNATPTQCAGLEGYNPIELGKTCVVQWGLIFNNFKCE